MSVRFSSTMLEVLISMLVTFVRGKGISPEQDLVKAPKSMPWVVARGQACCDSNSGSSWVSSDNGCFSYMLSNRMPEAGALVAHPSLCY